MMFQNLKKAVSYALTTAMVLGLVAVAPTTVLAADTAATVEAEYGSNKATLTLASGEWVASNSTGAAKMVLSATGGDPATYTAQSWTVDGSDKKIAEFTFDAPFRNNFSAIELSAVDGTNLIDGGSASNTVSVSDAISSFTNGVITSIATGDVNLNRVVIGSDEVVVKLNLGEFGGEILPGYFTLGGANAPGFALVGVTKDNAKQVTLKLNKVVPLTEVESGSPNDTESFQVDIDQRALRAEDAELSAASIKKAVAIPGVIDTVSTTDSKVVTVYALTGEFDETASKTVGNWTANNCTIASVKYIDAKTVEVTLNESPTGTMTLLAKKEAFVLGTATADSATDTLTPTATATISNVTVSGTVDKSISAKTVTLDLGNATLDATVQAGARVNTWFPNLPSGINAKVKKIALAGASTVEVEFTGIPATQSTEAIEVDMTGDTTPEVVFTANANAKFNITKASGSDSNNNSSSSGSSYGSGGTGASLTATGLTDPGTGKTVDFLSTGAKKVVMEIGKSDAVVDGTDKTFGADYGAPYVDASGNTMIPVRLFAEAVGCDVKYDYNTKNITITDGKGNSLVLNLYSSSIMDGSGNVVGTLKDAAGNSVTPYFNSELNRVFLPYRAVLEGIFGAATSEITLKDGVLTFESTGTSTTTTTTTNTDTTTDSDTSASLGTGE